MVEVRAARLLAAVRDTYVSGTAAALRAEGWTVSVRSARGLPECGVVTVETRSRAVTLECVRDGAGAWSWRRAVPYWQCPADRLDRVLAYVQQVEQEVQA